MENLVAQKKDDVKQVNKADSTINILSTLGAIGGLYYAYSKGKGFWGYVGFFVLGGIAGSLVGNVVVKFKKPKLNKEKPTNIAITPNDSPVYVPVKNENQKEPIQTGNEYYYDKLAQEQKRFNSLTKKEKIDEIIKLQISQNPNTDADDTKNSRLFLDTLTEAELNIWLPLTKAMNDSEIKNESNKDKAFERIEKKYKITKKQAEEQGKKLGDFMFGALKSAFDVVENKSKFSNFESSLDLDLDY